MVSRAIVELVHGPIAQNSAVREKPKKPAASGVDLRPLGTTPSAPICKDTRGQEGQEFLGLLHEAGAVTVERRHARGEVIFAKGDPGNALYILTEGAVKLSRDYPEGKEATLMLLGPWEVFGKLALGHRAYQHGRAEVVMDCRGSYTLPSKGIPAVR